VPPNKLGIEIEAALAFGTGHHGTTRGCLLAARPGAEGAPSRRVLDLGTGTGVLAIAAAKALQRRCWPATSTASVQVARDNRRLNESAIWCRRSGRPDFQRRNSRRRAVRSGAGEHPRQSVAADGNADGAASRTVGVGDPVGLLPHQASGVIAAYRARGLVLVRHVGSKAGAAC
jgi:ribosomal protein L11 methyltransferase